MIALDFAALPPEVNSGRMYAGAGSGPMVAAVAAWNGLASELNTAAASYQSVVSELTGQTWTGPASASMAAAAAPYVEWMQTAAAQAEKTAAQAMAVVSAYEAAFAATVPPPVVAANRSLLAALVATNVLGQNAAAIAANQAEYAEMWAQDASAMYSYASGASAAAQLTPFASPPQSTNSSGQANQAAAVNQATASAGSGDASSVIQNLGGTGGPFQWLIDLLNNPWVTGYESLTGAGALAPYFGLADGLNFNAIGIIFDIIPGVNAAMIPFVALVQGMAMGPASAVGALASADSALGAAGLGSSGLGTLATTVGGSEVSASMGRAAPLGGLSVPKAWGSVAPEIRLASAATAVPAAGLAGAPLGATGMAGGMPLMGPVGSVVNAPRNGENRMRANDPRQKVIARLPGEMDVYEPGRTPSGEVGLNSWTERDELEQLRKSAAKLERERDVLKRSASLLIKESTQGTN